MAWKIKRAPLSSSSGNLDEEINRWYELGQANGARRGKPFGGGGGGGFLLFYAEEPAKVRDGMAAENPHEVRFAFDHDGSTVVTRD